MSVTLSYMFRKPITSQYPDRMSVSVNHTIPARYRGFLEVTWNLHRVPGCERACPSRSSTSTSSRATEAGPKLRMERFDIDIGKCMYCGLCVEPCPTGAIQHTREFEGAVMHFNNLTLRFVPDVLQPVVAYKPPKGADAFPAGSWRDHPALIKAWDAPPPPFPSKEEAAKAAEHGKPRPARWTSPRWVASSRPRAASQGRQPKLQKVIEEAMAGTDCGDCGYPDCFGYSDAIAQGRTSAPRSARRAGRTRRPCWRPSWSRSDGCVPGLALGKYRWQRWGVSDGSAGKYRMAALGDTIKTWCPRVH